MKTNEPVQSGTCDKCGKPKFGPWSTIASGLAAQILNFYCMCGTIYNSVPEPVPTAGNTHTNFESSKEWIKERNSKRTAGNTPELVIKIPVTIEARQFTEEMAWAYLLEKKPLPLGVKFCRAEYHGGDHRLDSFRAGVTVAGGTLVMLEFGDWILRDPNTGDTWPIKSEIYATTYRRVAASSKEAMTDSEWINKLPDRARQYIHDLETKCDPAGDIRTIAELRDTVRALKARVAEFPKIYCPAGWVDPSYAVAPKFGAEATPSPAKLPSCTFCGTPMEFTEDAPSPATKEATPRVAEACRNEFKLRHGYFCELPKNHVGEHEAACPNPAFSQRWPQEATPSPATKDSTPPGNDLTLENLLPLFWELIDAVCGKFNPYAVPDSNDRWREAVALCKRKLADAPSPAREETPLRQIHCLRLLRQANDLLRSAHEIALRDGKSTNWEAFRNRVNEGLVAQHEYLYPKADAGARSVVVVPQTDKITRIIELERDVREWEASSCNYRNIAHREQERAESAEAKLIELAGVAALPSTPKPNREPIIVAEKFGLQRWNICIGGHPILAVNSPGEAKTIIANISDALRASRESGVPSSEETKERALINEARKRLDYVLGCDYGSSVIVDRIRAWEEEESSLPWRELPAPPVPDQTKKKRGKVNDE